jgi:hypothetical protein
MDDDGGVTWDKSVNLIFIIAAAIVLLLLAFFMFAMPMFKD